MWFQNRRTKHKRLQQESDSDTKSQRGSDAGGDNEIYKRQDLNQTEEDSQQSYGDSDEQTNVALDGHNSYMLQDGVNSIHQSQEGDDEDEVIDMDDYEDDLEGLTCSSSNDRLHHLPMLQLQEISQYRQQPHQHFLSSNSLVVAPNHQHPPSHLYLDQQSFGNIPSSVSNAKYFLQNRILSQTEVQQS